MESVNFIAYSPLKSGGFLGLIELMICDSWLVIHVGPAIWHFLGFDVLSLDAYLIIYVAYTLGLDNGYIDPYMSKFLMRQVPLECNCINVGSWWSLRTKNRPFTAMLISRSRGRYSRPWHFSNCCANSWSGNLLPKEPKPVGVKRQKRAVSGKWDNIEKYWKSYAANVYWPTNNLVIGILCDKIKLRT